MSSLISYLTHPIVLSATIGMVAYHVTESTGSESQAPIFDPKIASVAAIVVAYYMLSGGSASGGGGAGESFASYDYSSMGF